MQGRSLVPILAGRRRPTGARAFYYHYFEFPAPHHVRPHYGVITDRYKLVHFYGTDVDYWELFDLKKDPQEMKSVSNEPAHAVTQKELQSELARLRKELQVPEQDSPEAFGNAGKGGGKKAGK